MTSGRSAASEGFELARLRCGARTAARVQVPWLEGPADCEPLAVDD
jgi:hypothetical protein